MEIGAQFFTIRDFCRDTASLDESLKKVADIGYKTIQLSGVCAYEPEWMAERLKAYGLSADITHFDYKRYAEETDEMIRFHDIIGCKYMGIGGFGGILNGDFSAAILDETINYVTPAVKKIKESGHKFMYHNHNREFARMDDGRTILEHLCDYFPADEMGITLDTYWVVAGGGDPVEWLRKLEGRVDCAHFKDMGYNLNDEAVRMLAIGEGNMNYSEIIKACEDTGVKFGYVEQDNCNGENPFDCLKVSFDYFRSYGLC